MANFALGPLAIAHNGNLVNATELEREGAISFKGRDFYDRIINAMKQVNGAFSLLILREKELIAVRDPMALDLCASTRLTEHTSLHQRHAHSILSALNISVT